MSLRGRSGARDAEIHRVSGDVDGVDRLVTKGQWIATGYALAMTRCDGFTMKGVKRLECSHCHCEEGTE